MWTARVGEAGTRGARGMEVRTPRELPARSTARTVTADAGGSSKVRAKVPSSATSTGASSTVIVAASFTRPLSVTGALRTAGVSGPVISISGLVWSTVKVHERRTGHGTNGWCIAKLSVWTPSSRSRGRYVSTPSPTKAWSRTSPPSYSSVAVCIRLGRSELRRKRRSSVACSPRWASCGGPVTASCGPDSLSAKPLRKPKTRAPRPTATYFGQRRRVRRTGSRGGRGPPRRSGSSPPRDGRARSEGRVDTPRRVPALFAASQWPQSPRPLAGSPPGRGDRRLSGRSPPGRAPPPWRCRAPGRRAAGGHRRRRPPRGRRSPPST